MLGGARCWSLPNKCLGLTLRQNEAAEEHFEQEDKPGQGVGCHNGARQGCYQAEEGQGILMSQEKDEQEAEEPVAAGVQSEQLLSVCRGMLLT